MSGIVSLFQGSAGRNLHQGGTMLQYDDLIAKARTTPHANGRAQVILLTIGAINEVQR
jgi:hypothetical protein